MNFGEVKMIISYKKMTEAPYIFRQITGITIDECEEVVKKVRPEWEELEKQKKRHGRKSHIKTLEDKVLCTLIYYRACISHPFLGSLFKLHNSNICRLLKKMEPLLAKKVSIKRDETLTKEKILEILTDVKA